MSTIIIENKLEETERYERPDTTQSTMFICYDGRLYSGHWLKTNIRTGKLIIGSGEKEMIKY